MNFKEHFDAARKEPARGLTFASALLGDVPWASPPQPMKAPPMGPPAGPPAGPLSEKRQALEGLQSYVEERIEKAPENKKIKIPGGEIRVKEEQTGQEKSWSISSLPKECSSCDPELMNASLLKSDQLESPLKILFLGEACQGGEDGEAQLIVTKMIQAMGLSPNEAGQGILGRCHPDLDLEKNPCFENCLGEIFKWKPQYVVSMGAISTALLLGKRERISKVRGQFYRRQVHSGNDCHNFTLMPLFHPNYLVINPNMKRSAWNDLQKIIQGLDNPL